MSVAPAFAPVCLDVYRTNVGIFVKSLWNGYYNSSCKVNGILCTEGIQKPEDLYIFRRFWQSRRSPAKYQVL